MKEDLYSRDAEKFGIDRIEAKSLYYKLVFGAKVAEVQKILKCSGSKAQEVFDSFWEGRGVLEVDKNEH